MNIDAPTISRKVSPRKNKGNRLAMLLEKPCRGAKVIDDISSSFPPPLKESSILSTDSGPSISGSGVGSLITTRLRPKSERLLARKHNSCNKVHEKLGDNEFIVERILGYKWISKRRYARVKWQGYSHSSWEPVDSIFYFSPGKKPKKTPGEIVGHRDRKGNREYKVHWEGYPPECDKWVMGSRLNCKNLISQYLQKVAEQQTTNSVFPEPLVIPASPRPKKKSPGKKRKFLMTEAELETGDIPLVEPEVTVFFEEVIVKTESEPERMPEVREKPVEDKLVVDEIPATSEPTHSNVVADSQLEVMRLKEEKNEQIKTEIISAPQLTISLLTETQEQLREATPPPVKEKSVDQMNCEELREFLTKNGYAVEATKLFEKHVDGQEFVWVKDATVLQKLGVPLGPGLKMCKLIRDLRGKTV